MTKMVFRKRDDVESQTKIKKAGCVTPHRCETLNILRLRIIMKSLIIRYVSRQIRHLFDVQHKSI